MPHYPKQASAGFPLVGVLGLIFVTLKLCGVISWSWLWVLAPFWIPLAIGVGIVAVLAVIALIIAIISNITSR